MIKRVVTFVSGVQESVLVDFVSQNEVKTCQNSRHQKFPNPYKNEKTYVFFEFLSSYLNLMRSFI